MAQLEESFQSFSPAVWFLCVIISVISIFLLSMKIKLTRFRRQIFRLRRQPQHEHTSYDVITHMTNLGHMCNSSGTFRKTLFIVLSLFSFLVGFHLCSLIKTQLVITSSPSTLHINSSWTMDAASSSSKAAVILIRSSLPPKEALKNFFGTQASLSTR